MARAKGWYTHTLVSGSEAGTDALGDFTIASSLVNPTVLRTRAFAALAFADLNGPPFNPGNAYSPLVLRLVITSADDPPESGWEIETQGIDDVTYHPLVWDAGLYVPASLDLSRPELVFSNAALAGGVVDVKSERHFDGDTDVLVSFFIGPGAGGGSVADSEWTGQLWVRCLIEADI